jgi:3'-phosphoadenosine 5'-phosphosulfate sulfotransferase (PAPS reductase)/FAD synthetase
MSRLVCWWSAGATSAVATKLALEKSDLTPIIAYCDTGSEHPDNERFRLDCQDWYGQEIVVLKSKTYSDVWDVFERTRYLVGPRGARCTGEMKKLPRRDFELPDDLQVFGFDASESQRAERFQENNPEVKVWFPLIEAAITKQDCIAKLNEVGIEIPAMYKLGYKNNNCIGCPKGQAGYWNKIRVDFPETFERMAKLERELNAAICKSYAGDGKRKRVFLDELPLDLGRYESELDVMQCGLVCGE